MGLLDWAKGMFSHRGKALALYRSGMAKAKIRDYRGAVVDYTRAMEEPKIPQDVMGMAIYNRALAYSALDEAEKAEADLAKMLQMPGLPENVRVQAQQRRERLRRRQTK